MPLAADLHLHSHYASGVSPAMTFENIAITALRKGLDILGTGDCLQADWQSEVAAATTPNENGLLALKPEFQQRVWARVPENLRRPLYFVWSTEVDCLPPTKTKFQGLHHLLYFPTSETAKAFAEKLRSHGDLSEGRPTVNLTPLQLLELSLEHDPACHFAPAHILNPWFSDLGTIGGVSSLEELYVDLTPELLAVETGLTSIPPMCRRVSSMDQHALFSCSDAHSLDNLGREFTLLDFEPSYDALFAALSDPTAERVVQTIKFPLHETRYYLNWCSRCKASFDAHHCPRCGRALVAGSRDRLEKIADRVSVSAPSPSRPPHQQLRPLRQLIARSLKASIENPTVARIEQTLLEDLGHERYILLDATKEQLGKSRYSVLACSILEQRKANTEYFKPAADSGGSSVEQQATLDFG